MSATATHEGGSTPKTIWKTFWILLAITVGEIIFAVLVAPHFANKMVPNLLYAVLSFAKAGYIISEFMHMKYEVKNLIRTVGIPCCLLIWLVLAFFMDGTSWKHMMNKPLPPGAETEATHAAAPVKE